MLSWSIKNGLIQIEEIENDFLPDGKKLVAPFSPVSAALVDWADEKELVMVTPNPLIDYDIKAAWDKANQMSDVAAYVSQVRFYSGSIDKEFVAEFDMYGQPNSPTNERNLISAEEYDIGRINVVVHVVNRHEESFDVDWLVWHRYNRSLGFSITQNADDLETIKNKIDKTCSELILFGADLDTDYIEILGLETSREVELAYFSRNLEDRVQKIAKPGSKPIHPETVDVVMDLFSLNDDDMLAYLRSRGYTIKNSNEIE